MKLRIECPLDGEQQVSLFEDDRPLRWREVPMSPRYCLVCGGVRPSGIDDGYGVRPIAASENLSAWGSQTVTVAQGGQSYSFEIRVPSLCVHMEASGSFPSRHSGGEVTKEVKKAVVTLPGVEGSVDPPTGGSHSEALAVELVRDVVWELGNHGWAGISARVTAMRVQDGRLFVECDATD